MGHLGPMHGVETVAKGQHVQQISMVKIHRFVGTVCTGYRGPVGACAVNVQVSAAAGLGPSAADQPSLLPVSTFLA